MAKFIIEQFDKSKHVRTGFSCGKPPLDDFLLRLVSQYVKRDLGRTFVAVCPDNPQIVGYYTLAMSAVGFEELPPPFHKLPRHPVPVILLGRLAVDARNHGQGLGQILLMDALKRSAELSEKVGCHAVRVDAIDASAKSFYMKYGFISLSDQDMGLVLSMATVRQLIAEESGSK
jgi:predicted GNAT family N-acyltransferase